MYMVAMARGSVYEFMAISITIAGKTGTSQISLSKPNVPVISFAPFEKPEIAVTVVIPTAIPAAAAETARDKLYFILRTRKN